MAFIERSFRAAERLAHGCWASGGRYWETELNSEARGVGGVIGILMWSWEMWTWGFDWVVEVLDQIYPALPGKHNGS